MKGIKKYSWLFLLTIMVSLAQAQPFFKSSKAQFVGVLNDTVFYAGSSECFVYLIGGKNEFEIIIPTKSIKSDRASVDSLFHHIYSSEIKITGKVNDGIFKLNSTENSEKDEQMPGSIYMNNEDFDVIHTYRIYGNSTGMPSQRKMFLDLRCYFDPNYFHISENNQHLSNLMEFLIQGGYINQKN